MYGKRNITTTTTAMNTLSKAAPSSTVPTKFKIEQKVLSGSMRKGPYAVERSVDPNEVVIKRRYGEGAKPLFQRDDIAINRGGSDASAALSNSNPHSESVQGHPRRSSTDSSSPERYRARGTNTTHSSSRQMHTSRRAVYAATPTASVTTKRRTPEKVPYFLDEKREKDRLRRIYGSGDTIETDPAPKQRRRRSYSRSRSRSPPQTSAKLKKPTFSGSSAHAHRRRSRSQSRCKEKSHKHHSSTSSAAAGAHRQRSSSDEDQRRRSQRNSHHHSSRSLHHSGKSDTNRPRRPSSRSVSRSRSRSHERRKRSARSRERGRERDNGGNRDHGQYAAQPASATQFVAIPVPVAADYPYAYPTWHPPPHGWGPIPPPPPRFGPYRHAHHMAPMMPDTAMLRPPHPYGLPLPRMFQPHYPLLHSQRGRSTRGVYRPKNA